MKKSKWSRTDVHNWVREQRAPHSAVNQGGKSFTPHPRGDLGKNIADVDFPIVVGYELNGRPQSEIAYSQDELDEILDYLAPLGSRGRDIPYSLNSLDEIEPSDTPMGLEIEQYRESTVKITKNQLRRIIREFTEEEEEEEEELEVSRWNVLAGTHEK